MWKLLFAGKKEFLKKFLFKKQKSFKQKFDKSNLHRLYEVLEYEDRQVKYVINGQRLYEFFGYEWRLPLWDKLYLNFWESVPLKYKLDQNLFKDTLIKTNWGNVWKDIPLNPKNNFPLSIKFVRLLFKILLGPLGKKYWYSFEKQYLDYVMDKLCGYAQWKYLTIISDKRGFRNSLSWEIEKYLNNKNISWNGKSK